MTEIQNTTPVTPGINRRRVVAGAAWAVPVVATALAAPAAAASPEGEPNLAVTGTQSGLLTLNLLDGGGTLTAQALTTVPTAATLTTTPSGGDMVNQGATVTVTVGRPAGINIPVGRARGFGVYSFNGVPSTAGERTTTYQSAPLVGQFGMPTTTFTTRQVFNLPAGGSQVLPIVFGLAGVSTGVAISLLATFPVTITMAFDNGMVRTATSSISVPVGAGLL